MNEPRDQALQALYEMDQRGFKGVEALEALPSKAIRLVEGVLRHRSAIDERISAASSTWRIERMPAVDRCVLRLGIYELLWEPDTPVGVVTNEAVRLAKTYSTEKSGSFINGVLAAIAEQRDQP